MILGFQSPGVNAWASEKFVCNNQGVAPARRNQGPSARRSPTLTIIVNYRVLSRSSAKVSLARAKRAGDNNTMAEDFIGEAIEPVAATFDTSRMADGGPGLPREFRWRSEVVQIARVLSSWRETGPCRNGSEELYVRKHWFEVQTQSGATMRIYFDRQPRSRSAKKSDRWWLFSVVTPSTLPEK
jgi:hypothetical protein